jgi:1-deoxy-D-xylulose 5-phosphate reductoisomerase
MRLPIQYALTYPAASVTGAGSPHLVTGARWNSRHSTPAAIRRTKRALTPRAPAETGDDSQRGDEAAVAAFLAGTIGFPRIAG